MIPIQLTCKHKEQQLTAGLAPRFSWLLQSDSRGAKQSACRILCSSTKEQIQQNIGDLWDSSKTPSSAHTLIPYAGNALEEMHRYWWKVLVWDSMSNSFKESAESWFETGIISRECWQAAWITKSNIKGTSSFIRKVEGNININADRDSQDNKP